MTAAKRRWLDEHLQRQWRRPPTSAESDRFVADYVREEILYRKPWPSAWIGTTSWSGAGSSRRWRCWRSRAGDLDRRRRTSWTTTSSHRADFAVPAVDLVPPRVLQRRRPGRSRVGAMPGPPWPTSRPGPFGRRPPRRPPARSRVIVTDWTRPMVEDRFGPGFAASVFECRHRAPERPLASAYGVAPRVREPAVGRRDPRLSRRSPTGPRPTWTPRDAGGALDRSTRGSATPTRSRSSRQRPRPRHPAHGHSHDDVHNHERDTSMSAPRTRCEARTSGSFTSTPPGRLTCSSSRWNGPD